MWFINSEGDGRNGYEQFAPYDIIHVGAAAPKTPHVLLNQLKNGGRLIAPIGPKSGPQHLEMVYKFQYMKIIQIDFRFNFSLTKMSKV